MFLFRAQTGLRKCTIILCETPNFGAHSPISQMFNKIDHYPHTMHLPLLYMMPVLTFLMTTTFWGLGSLSSPTSISCQFLVEKPKIDHQHKTTTTDYTNLLLNTSIDSCLLQNTYPEWTVALEKYSDIYTNNYGLSAVRNYSLWPWKSYHSRCCPLLTMSETFIKGALICLYSLKM